MKKSLKIILSIIMSSVILIVSAFSSYAYRVARDTDTLWFYENNVALDSVNCTLDLYASTTQTQKTSATLTLSSRTLYDMPVHPNNSYIMLKYTYAYVYSWTTGWWIFEETHYEYRTQTVTRTFYLGNFSTNPITVFDTNIFNLDTLSSGQYLLSSQVWAHGYFGNPSMWDDYPQIQYDFFNEISPESVTYDLYCEGLYREISDLPSLGN